MALSPTVQRLETVEPAASQLGPRGEMELRQDGSDLVFHGVHRAVETTSNLLIREACARVAEDLALARCQMGAARPFSRQARRSRDDERQYGQEVCQVVARTHAESVRSKGRPQDAGAKMLKRLTSSYAIGGAALSLMPAFPSAARIRFMLPSRAA
jgi:hypothetical protein